MSIIGVIVAFLIAYFSGPFGWIILLSLIFGLQISNYSSNKKIHSDLKMIKEKLGIIEIDEYNMPDEQIEKELEDEILREEEKRKH